MLSIYLQVLLLAGGNAEGSTEKFITGENSWSVVGSLPRRLYWISGATLSMNNKIYIFGEVLLTYDAVN